MARNREGYGATAACGADSPFSTPNFREPSADVMSLPVVVLPREGDPSVAPIERASEKEVAPSSGMLLIVARCERGPDGFPTLAVPGPPRVERLH
jgi:hypothetical protein